MNGTRVCSVESCELPRRSKGLCNAHRRRLLATGSVQAEKPIRPRKGYSKTCSADECSDLAGIGGLCNAHAARRRRYGSPDGRPDDDGLPIGARSGSLEVVGYAGGPRTYVLKCDCGAAVTMKHSWLKDRQSCGCRRHDRRLSEDVGYSAAHARVHAAKGAASGHDCVDCGSSAEEWSYNHADPDERFGRIHADGPESAYSLAIECYEPRCRSCHLRFDYSKGLRGARLRSRR